MNTIPPVSLELVVAETGLQLLAGDPSLTISGLSADSRQITAGMLFVATTGLTVDGHDFIDKAISAGATAVLAKAGHTQPRKGVAWLETDNPNEALGKVAATVFDHPSKQLALVGITGTNGKTTVATLCCEAFTALGYRCGLIGTVEVRLGETRRPATHTTPDATAIQQLLAEMLEVDCTYVFMEVSSHALVQHRTAGCHFVGAVFTNISHDHLDYHGDMLSYINAKKLLFDGLGKNAFAIINADDKRGEVMVQNTRAKVKRYALRQLADYKGRILEDGLRGLHLLVNEQEVYTRIAGHFNAYNFLAAFGVGVELDHSAEEMLAVLSALPGAAGRLEVVAIPDSQLTGIVDYAHTPDALKNVLETLQGARRAGHRVLTVFGCGGDRDSTKRPIMGAIAAELSDQVIITDDNPRSEDPDDIRESIAAGVKGEAKAKLLIIGDRRQAIRTAVRMGHHEDVILLAGKGHENYQEAKGTRIPFDDRVELRLALEQLAAGRNIELH